MTSGRERETEGSGRARKCWCSSKSNSSGHIFLLGFIDRVTGAKIIDMITIEKIEIKRNRFYSR